MPRDKVWRRRGRQRTDRAQPAGTDPVVSRLNVLCASLWDNNISAMARAIGVPHTVVFRVLRKGQFPPGEFLLKLMTHPGVDILWVLSGDAGDADPVRANFSCVEIRLVLELLLSARVRFSVEPADDTGFTVSVRGSSARYFKVIAKCVAEISATARKLEAP